MPMTERKIKSRKVCGNDVSGWVVSLLCGLIICINLFWFFCIGHVLAEEPNVSEKNIVEIEYGYPDQSIFVATTNAKGQPDTPMTFLAEALMTRAGLPWHAMPYPARRLFNNLKNGTTHFSILVRASSLRESCIFSQKPVYSTKLNIYYIGDKFPVKSKQDLIGKQLITIRGYSYGGLLEFISNPDNKIFNGIAGTHKAAFQMLKNDRADYLLDYAAAADDILYESPIADITSNSISQLDIFLVLSKSYPGAEKLMVKLEEIVETLDVNEILKRKGK